jgi:dTDP-4-dehydrorhamnose 3,5-epimerase
LNGTDPIRNGGGGGLTIENLKATPIFEKLSIDGACIVKFPVFEDTRGTFQEWFNQEVSSTIFGKPFIPMQANLSSSKRNTIRGVHYSLATNGQSKWVICAFGKVKDVIVDLRLNSPTFKKYIQVDLEANSGKALCLAEGLGHAFLAVSELSVIAYLTSSTYSPEFEFSINPLDAELAIDWGISRKSIIFSKRDAEAPSFNDMKSNNLLPNLRN